MPCDGSEPSGTVIFPGGRGRLWTYTVETGAIRRIGECDFATWMEDGVRILCNRGGRVLVVDASTGRTTDLQVAAVSGGAGPRLAVNDSQLFFFRGTTSADIWIARFEQPATSR